MEPLYHPTQPPLEHPSQPGPASPGHLRGPANTRMAGPAMVMAVASPAALSAAGRPAGPPCTHPFRPAAAGTSVGVPPMRHASTHQSQQGARQDRDRTCTTARAMRLQHAGDQDRAHPRAAGQRGAGAALSSPLAHVAAAEDLCWHAQAMQALQLQAGDHGSRNATIDHVAHKHAMLQPPGCRPTVHCPACRTDRVNRQLPHGICRQCHGGTASTPKDPSPLPGSAPSPVPQHMRWALPGLQTERGSLTDVQLSSWMHSCCRRCGTTAASSGTGVAVLGGIVQPSLSRQRGWCPPSAPVQICPSPARWEGWVALQLRAQRE